MFTRNNQLLFIASLLLALDLVFSTACAEPAKIKIGVSTPLSGDSATFPDLLTLLNEGGEALYAEYKKKFGPLRSSESTFPTTIEGFRAIDAAIQSGREPREFLYSTLQNGIYGPYSFDKLGESDGIPVIMKQISSGKVVTVEN